MLVAGSLACAETTVSLQLKRNHQFRFAGYYMAIEKGYYKNAGLNVVLLEADPHTLTEEAVLDNHANFGIGGAELVVLRGRNKPVVVLASIFQHSGIVFVTRADSGIDNIHQLSGKRIAMNPLNIELLQYLKSEGIGQNQFQLVNPSLEKNKLLTDEADALGGYIGNQTLDLHKANVDFRVFSPRNAGIDFYGDSLYTTESFLKENPQTVEAFIKASRKGWDTAFRDPDETIKLIQTKYNPELTTERLQYEERIVRDLVMPNAVDIGFINPQRWRRIARIYSDFGVIPGNFNLGKFIYKVVPEEELIIPRNTAVSEQAQSASQLSSLPAQDSLPETSNRFVDWLDYGTLILLGISTIVLFLQNRRLHARIADRNSDYDLHRNQGLLEHAPFPIMIIDADSNRIVFTNSRCGEVLDVLPEMLIGKSMGDLWVNPLDQESVTSALTHKGFLKDTELELKKATGDHFWASCSGALVQFKGHPAYFITVTDFTGIYEIKQKLIVNHERYQVMADAVPAMMASINYRYQFEFANQTCREWLGLGTESPITITAHKLINGHLHELLEKTQLQFDDNQPLKSAGFEVTADGKRRYIDMTVIPRRALQGYIEGWFVLATDVTAWREMEIQLKEIALTDELTGLNNRRFFNQAGPSEVTRAIRYGRPLSLLILDIDLFKNVNDTYGHAVGDLVLKNLAAMLRQRFRMMDSVARTGGEEFVALLPETSTENAMEIAEQFRRDVEMSTVIIDGQVLRFTISIGVAGFDSRMNSLLDLLRAADQALYQAKTAGRNRVVQYIHEEKPEPPAEEQNLPSDSDQIKAG